MNGGEKMKKEIIKIFSHASSSGDFAARCTQSAIESWQKKNRRAKVKMINTSTQNFRCSNGKDDVVCVVTVVFIVGRFRKIKD